VHEVRSKNQADALLPEPGKHLAQRGDSLGMRMADSNRFALLAGIPNGKFDLFSDGFRIEGIIQEHFARSGRNAEAASGVVSDGGSRGTAIDEEKPAFAQVRHQGGHEGRVRRRFGAFVVVHPRGVRHGGQHSGQHGADLGGRHAGAEFDDAGWRSFRIRLHGQMQHHFVTAAGSLVGNFNRQRKMRKDRNGQRVRKRQDGVVFGAVIAHVVQDDGQARAF